MTDAERIAELEAEVARLRLPPDETLSEHPGCVYCMEAGTPVRPGQVCPKCGDRRPTKRELEADELDAKLAAFEQANTELPRELTGAEWRIERMWQYAVKLRVVAMALKARLENAEIDCADQWNEAYQAALKRAEQAEAALATARQEERERYTRWLSGHGYYGPWPDFATDNEKPS